MKLEPSQLIIATYFRHGASFQNMRRDSVSEILLKLLYLKREKADHSFQEIKNLFPEVLGIDAPSGTLIQESLNVLINEQLMIRVNDPEQRYRLSPKGLIEIDSEEQLAVTRLDRILGNCFNGGALPASDFRDAFLEIIAAVASNLAEESARLLNGEANGQISLQVIEEIIAQVAKRHENLDVMEIRKGVTRFFEQQDMDSKQLLWNATQSFYVARLLGFDRDGSFLSRGVFESCEFIVDTNILVPLIEGLHPQSGAIRKVINELQRQNIRHVVTGFTIDELEGVLRRDLEDIEALSEIQGGSQLIQNHLLGGEAEDGDRETAVTAEGARFINELVNRYGFRILDGGYFDDDEFNRLSDELQLIPVTRYGNLAYKRRHVAEHDAKLLLLARDRRRQRGRKGWILTLDSALFRIDVPNWSGELLVIQPQALLQWCGLSASSDQDDQGFADAFATILTGRLFPNRNFLTSTHLRQILAMQDQIGDLSANDQALVIDEIKRVAVTAELDSAEGRELLNAAWSMFIANPDTDYRRNLERIEAEKAEALEAIRGEYQSQNQSLALAISEKEDQIAKKTRENEAIVRMRDNEMAEAADARFDQIAAMTLVLLAVIAFTSSYFLGDVLPNIWRVNAENLVVLLSLGLIRIFGVEYIKDWIGHERLPHLSPKRRRLLGLESRS